jgi:hypothetical protein
MQEHNLRNGHDGGRTQVSSSQVTYVMMNLCTRLVVVVVQ